MPLEEPEGSEESVGSRNEEKLKLLEQIANSTDEARREELADVEDDGSTTPVEATPATEEAPPPQVAPTPPPQKRKLKVNGKEIELTDEEILERAQKVEAADDYLREAAKLWKDTRKQVSDGQAVAAPAEQPDKVDDDDLALARALQVGNEEEAAKAIRLIEQRVQARMQKTTVPVEQQIFQAIDLKKMQDKWESENQDVLADPVLKTVVVVADSQLQKSDAESGITRTPYERWTAAAKVVRDWKAQLAGPQSFEAKQKAKSESVKVIPTASARAVVPKDDDEGEDNPVTVIANMAKQRQGRHLNS